MFSSVSTGDGRTGPTLHDFLTDYDIDGNTSASPPAATTPLASPLYRHGSLLWSSSTLPFCLRRVSLRDTAAKSNNYSACGFDLFLCPVSSTVRNLEEAHAKTIFHNLVLAGACPIGLTEEAALQLDCDPPLPLFPRDYPDTVQGKLYWSSNIDQNDWVQVRNHLEGGGGRIRIKCEEPVPNSLDWSELVASSASSNAVSSSDPSIVMVREAFADPFRKALARVGYLPSAHHNAADQKDQLLTARRYRRPADMPFCVAAQRRVKAEFAAHQQLCQTLSSALTLPAVLLCHVQVLGRGVLRPGARLYHWTK